MTAAHTSHWRNVWKRRLAKYSRWLHIYVSMASFAIVFFFAITGLTLNHPEWFDGAERTSQVRGQLDAAWMRAGADDVARLDIVEYLRRVHHISGAVADFRVDGPDVSIAFKGPGYAADVLADREHGTYELTETRLGFVAVINDLHKGRDSGAVWKGIIDGSAVVLSFISLTGLVLLYFLHKHRLAGAILLLMGAAASYAAYVAWVP